MSDKFQTNIDLQGNSIEKGSFERLTTPPTEDNFLGRQIELDGVPHFYNGEEFESFWRQQKANAENEAYEVTITSLSDNLVSLILSKYGHIDKSRNIFVYINIPDSEDITNNYSRVFDLFKLGSNFKNIPYDIRYNVFLFNSSKLTLKLYYGSLVSLNGSIGFGSSQNILLDKKYYLIQFENLSVKTNLAPDIPSPPFEIFKFSCCINGDIFNPNMPLALGDSESVTNIHNFLGETPDTVNIVNLLSRIVEFPDTWKLSQGNPESIVEYNPDDIDLYNFPGILPAYLNIYKGEIKTRSLLLTLPVYGYNENPEIRNSYYIKDLIGLSSLSFEDKEKFKRYRFDFFITLPSAGPELTQISSLYFPWSFEYVTNCTKIVDADFDGEIIKSYKVDFSGCLKISLYLLDRCYVYFEDFGGQSTLSTIGAEQSNSNAIIRQFCQDNNLYSKENRFLNNVSTFNVIDIFATLINKLNQGGGGATGDFWDLLKANPEVSTALFKPLNTDTGVFAHLYADSRLDESRDIIVDFSTYAGGRVFTDFFSAYNLNNNNHPFSWTETNENSEKMKYVRYKMLLCNNPYTHPIAICVPDNPNIITNFSEVMTGLTYPNETQARYFYLFPNQSINVDFELIYLTGAEQPILAVININSFTGTATFDAQRTSSTENGTVISNYLTSNNIPCTVDKVTGQTLYNVQDLLANIITQINS